MWRWYKGGLGVCNKKGDNEVLPCQFQLPKSHPAQWAPIFRHFCQTFCNFDTKAALCPHFQYNCQMEIVKCQGSQGKRQGTGFLPEIIDESVQLLHSILFRENTFNLRALNCLFYCQNLSVLLVRLCNSQFVGREKWKGFRFMTGLSFFMTGLSFCCQRTSAWVSVHFGWCRCKGGQIEMGG